MTFFDRFFFNYIMAGMSGSKQKILIIVHREKVDKLLFILFLKKGRHLLDYYLSNKRKLNENSLTAVSTFFWISSARPSRDLNM